MPVYSYHLLLLCFLRSASAYTAERIPSPRPLSASYPGDQASTEPDGPLASASVHTSFELQPSQHLYGPVSLLGGLGIQGRTLEDGGPGIAR